MNAENALVQMRKGIIEFCVLHIISRGEIYTSDLITELTAAQMVVVEGTLYPLLNRLKNAGQLHYIFRESNSGPPRKYYSLTPQGQENLAALTARWADTVGSVQQIMDGTHKATPKPNQKANGPAVGQPIHKDLDQDQGNDQSNDQSQAIEQPLDESLGQPFDQPLEQPLDKPDTENQPKPSF